MNSTAALTPSAAIDARIHELAGWRGQALAHVRALLHQADPEIVEEWKWRGTPVFSHAGIVCTAESYKSVVKMTFARGAALPDPSHLFNASLDGNVRRAIDLHEGDTLDEAAFQALVRAAIDLNLKASGPRKPPSATKLRTKPATRPTRPPARKPTSRPVL